MRFIGRCCRSLLMPTADPSIKFETLMCGAGVDEEMVMLMAL